VWSNLPDTIDPIRSSADNAYAGNDCLTTAHEHGATPLHDLRKDHRHERFPETAYEKLCKFATHWPNRYEQLKRRRNLIETTVQTTNPQFRDRLKGQDPTAREHEIIAKQVAHNTHLLVLRQIVASA
jgi:hypothetical protein